MKRLNVVLEDDLHRTLKLTAIEHGMTISQYVTDMLQERLHEEKEKGDEK